MNERDIPIASDQRPTIRIYTHNIFGRREGWTDRREVLTDTARRLDPDIVMFQEEICTREYDQTLDIVGSHYHLAHSTGRSHPEGSGISITSRWPIIAVNELDLTIGGRPIDEFHWAALIATIDAPASVGPVMVVNYFPDAMASRENERERQAVEVARAIEELISDPNQLVILGGDLDADRDAASLRFLTGKQSLQGMSVCYRSCWEAIHPGEPGWTFDPRNDLFRNAMGNWPYRSVDHLLVRCGTTSMPPVSILDCQLVANEPVKGIWASDHFGLVADLG